MIIKPYDIYKINLMDLDDKHMKIPPVTFDSIITIPSSNFQKVCRDMYNISNNVEIKCVSKYLIFKQSTIENIESVYIKI